MWQLLLVLAVGLGAAGGDRTELSALERRGLQVALEEFHKYPAVQWAFHKTSVDNVVDVASPAGTFVKLEFQIQQTNCRKKDWKSAACRVKPNGRKRKCLACIKLDPEDNVLGRVVHCPVLTGGVRRKQVDSLEDQCEALKLRGEGGYYLPGEFAFSKALPPSWA